MAHGGRFAETADAAEREVLDDGVRHRPERIVLAVDTPARPALAGLAKRLLHIEQELVLRDRVEIVVHDPEHGMRT